MASGWMRLDTRGAKAIRKYPVRWWKQRYNRGRYLESENANRALKEARGAKGNVAKENIAVIVDRDNHV